MIKKCRESLLSIHPSPFIHSPLIKISQTRPIQTMQNHISPDLTDQIFLSYQSAQGQLSNRFVFAGATRVFWPLCLNARRADISAGKEKFFSRFRSQHRLDQFLPSIGETYSAALLLSRQKDQKNVFHFASNAEVQKISGVNLQSPRPNHSSWNPGAQRVSIVHRDSCKCSAMISGKRYNLQAGMFC